MASQQDIVTPLSLEDLVTIFRQEMDDLPGDTATSVNWKNDDTALLWKNQEIVRYANMAQIAFCHSIPIYDEDTNATVTQITVVQGTPTYAYSNKIMSIRRIAFENAAGIRRILKKKTQHELDRMDIIWDDKGTPDEGDVDYYLEDKDHRALTLVRSPEEAGTLHMTVSRLPINQMSWSKRNTDSPEIDPNHHWDLTDFMMWRGYLKRDAETEDKDLAKQAYERWQANVGPKPSAHMLNVRRKERNLRRQARAVYF